MCLMCNGKVPHQQFRFNAGDPVVFARRSAASFRESFPDTLTVKAAVTNDQDDVEKGGPQALLLTDVDGNDVVISGTK